MSLSGKGIPMSLSFESPDVEKDFPGLYASQVEVEGKNLNVVFCTIPNS